MPELTEVEAARRAIEEHCIGKKIVKSIVANDSKVIDGVSASNFEASLLNKTIVAAHRKGKNMWLQLGMAGAIYIKGVEVTKYKRSAVNDTDDWPSKYSKVFIELNDGLELSFTDKRRFAKVRLLDDPASVPPISELGPDALLELMTVDELYNALSKKKIGIKALLLDQGFISGIGNWIADEVLYQARIHPMQTASSLSKESCASLQRCIKEVIQHAVQVDDDSSRFPIDWLFHFRWGKKPGKVNGNRIEFITAGGRTTAYVPELQKLSGAPKATAKTSKASKRNKDVGEEDDDDNDNDVETEKPASVEVDAEKVKSKQLQSSNGGRKKPPKNKKSTRSNDDEDAELKKTGNKGRKAPPKRRSPVSSNDNDEDANKKSRVEGKKGPAKTMFEANTGPEGSDGHDDDSDSNRFRKKSHRVTKGRHPKVENSSKKKADTSQNDKITKKKAK